MKACLVSKHTTQCTKAILWNVGGGAALFIPVPVLNTAIMGSMFFMGMNAMVKHPDSVFMKKEASRQFVMSRTWKHITAGVLFSAAGWGFGGAALFRGVVWPVGWACLGGTAGSFAITYSDSLCARGPVPQGYVQV
jgi:hypothetical protein